MKGKLRKKVRYFFLHATKSCKEILPLMSQSLERRLGIREWTGMWVHMLVCRWCWDYLIQIRLLRAIARQFPDREIAGGTESPTLSSERRARIKRILSGKGKEPAG
jgi:hypothetical protein